MEKDIENQNLDEAVSIAQKIMINLVKDKYGEETVEKIEEVFEKIKVNIDVDPKIAEQCDGYFDETAVYLTERFYDNNKNKIYLIQVIIHEYAHAFSRLISKGEINAVIEEAFANLFSEMCINYYIQKEIQIPYISKEENDKLSENGYYEIDTYVEEGNFIKGIMYALEMEGKDIEGIGEYLFGTKKKFLEIGKAILEDKFEEIMEGLKNVRNWLGVENNTYQYLPKAQEDLIKILENYFQNNVGEECIDESDSRKNERLYSVKSSLLEKIYYERQMQYEWLGGKIDFENLTIEDIKKISQEADGKFYYLCKRFGYSDFIKNVISSWYNKTGGDLQQFDEILSITGGIPFEQLAIIIQDKNLTEDANTIVEMCSKYLKVVDKEICNSILEFLTQVTSKDVYEKTLKVVQTAAEITNKIFIFDDTISFLMELDMSNQQFQEVLKFFSNSEIKLENINNILEMIKGIDVREGSLENSAGAQILILQLVTSINGSITDDLGLLINVYKNLYSITGIKETIDLLDIQSFNEELLDRVQEAMEILEKYGLKIINQEQILEQIQKGSFEDIRIIPDKFSDMYAFIAEPNKTNILLRAFVNQFLERVNEKDFLEKTEELQTCLFLLDQTNQMMLGLDNDMQIKIIETLKQKNIEQLENEIKKAENRLNHNSKGKKSWDSVVEVSKEVTRRGEMEDVAQTIANIEQLYAQEKNEKTQEEENNEILL